MRSPWKKYYIDYVFKNAFLRIKDKSKRKEIVLFIDNRATTILKSMIDRKAGIHNGKEYVGLTVKDYMCGHKFGEYIATRKVGKDMHFRKKGKKTVQQNVKKKK